MTVTHILFPFIVVGCVRVLYRKAVSKDRVGPLPRRPCAAAIIKKFPRFLKILYCCSKWIRTLRRQANQARMNAESQPTGRAQN